MSETNNPNQKTSSEPTKKIIKVKLGEPVPASATLIKTSKEKKHNGDDDWYSGGTYTETEYAYYEVLND